MINNDRRRSRWVVSLTFFVTVRTAAGDAVVDIASRAVGWVK